MRKPAAIAIGILVLVGGTLIAAPFILSGAVFDKPRAASWTRTDGREVNVFAQSSLEAEVYPRLSVALKEMTATLDIGSAVAITPVHEASVIIAKDHEYWRTIPHSAVFMLHQGHAEVFLDHSEFDLYRKKYPELSRAGIRALRLDEFFNALLNNNDSS